MATTTTDPTGTPVSSPTTSVDDNPYGYIPLPTGTGSSTNMTLPPTTVEGTAPVVPTARAVEATYPQIWIATALPSATQNAVTLQFDYLPESVSFGVSATFDQAPIQFTSARWLTYNHSDIEEVSLTVKVVAGCNNCLTYFGGNTKGSQYGVRGGLAASKYVRNSLVTLAQILYSLPLPATNDLPGKGMPPPTCRLKVGGMFSGIGAFTRCSIQFNGPYDYDGSPTDMDVSLGFLPSEFYDSSSFQKMIESSAGLLPKSTPYGARQVSGNDSYALTFYDTQTGQGESEPSQSAVDATNAPNQGFESSEYPATPAEVPADQVQGPQTPTPTNQEVAIATGTPENQVFYDSAKDTYTLGGQYITNGVVVGGTEFPGDHVRKQVADSKTPNLGGGD
jgi:hypothetical protein